MKTLRYLNSVLTVIAVLLTLNLYVQLTAPAGGNVASFTTPAHAAEAKRGVGSQAARQNEMTKAIKQLAKTAEMINVTLTTGDPLRVKVENFPAKD